MNNKKFDAANLWKQFEDVLAPTLCLSHIDRAVYSLLLRHTLLEGRPRLRVSMNWLARAVRLTATTARRSIRRLVAKGVLRLFERTRDGHLVEVLDPGLIRPALATDATLTPLSGPAVIRRRRAGAPHSGPSALGSRHSTSAGPSASRLPNLSLRSSAGGPSSDSSNLVSLSSTDFEALDFLSTPDLRDAIYARDRGLCFYCLRRLKPRARCLDHVVPQFRSGGNSYRNLVGCCLECNSHKRHKPATDFLRSLYRDHRLTAAEFNARLAALEALAAGKLRPCVPAHHA